MFLADVIRGCMETNGFASVYVYGEMGHGKTSYALWLASEVVGWDKALDHLFFDPVNAIKKLREAHRRRERLPLMVLDDAGLWLQKQTWWEKPKVAFMALYNVIRSLTASIVFTSPVDDLPKPIRKKAFFRVSVQRAPLEEAKRWLGDPGYNEMKLFLEANGCDPRLWCIAKTYRLKTLPTFHQRVKRYSGDYYPLHYPRDVWKRYEEKRWKAIDAALGGVEQAIGIAGELIEDVSYQSRDRVKGMEAEIVEHYGYFLAKPVGKTTFPRSMHHRRVLVVPLQEVIAR